MGLAPAAYVLWTRILKHNPKNPAWQDRDRFILSAGHASMLLYSLLFLTGYGMTLDDIRNFRQWGSSTPGHPEFGCTPGVETTTGPLGQGFANAVGIAMAERHMAAVFNRPDYNVVDHYTFVMAGDGDMMEGVSSEAASMAGHLGLSRLICLYDDNKITIEGKTAITFTEDVAMRFGAYGWHVIKVEDGNDTEEIYKAIKEAQDEKKRPSLISLRTHIAYGSPNKQDSSSAHGEPLGAEEIILTKNNLGWPDEDPFFVPEEALRLFRKCIEKGEEAESRWRKTFEAYRDRYPDLAARWSNHINRVPEDGWSEGLPTFSGEDGPIATRAASGKTLNGLAGNMTNLVGGSADLAPSNKTVIESSHDFQKEGYDGRNIRFGVREHAMGAVLAGIALHGGLTPYGGTFLVFSDYMRPSIRLAGLMKLPVIYVFTHDSIAVGEDGPTHQPVEHLIGLRSIPGLTVIRPADATETVQAWRYAVTHPDGPVALILSRQKLPVLDGNRFSPAEGLERGAYILSDSEKRPEVILIGTGSEVHICLEAGQILGEKGTAVRVVSMPSWELFEKAPKEYRDRVLDPEVPARIAVEAGRTMGWERYTGIRGAVIGMDRFGASAPGGRVLEEFGFTAENIVQTAMGLLG